MSGLRKLSDILGEIWDRSHHIFPTRTSNRILLTWDVMDTDSLSLTDDGITIGTFAYPAKWGVDADSVEWGNGIWG